MADDPFESNYVLWIDDHTEGWHPHACDTLADCYGKAIDYSARSFKITHPPIVVELSELKASSYSRSPTQ